MQIKNYVLLLDKSTDPVNVSSAELQLLNAYLIKSRITVYIEPNLFFSLPRSVFSCVGVFWWISMSTTNNIAQARKLVEQLRIEAGIERIKVGW